MMTRLRFTDLIPHDIDFAVFQVRSEIAGCNLGTRFRDIHAKLEMEQNGTIGSLSIVH